MTEPLPKRERFVWLRLILLIVATLILLTPVGICMFLGFLLRMASRWGNCLLQLPSKWLFLSWEWIACLLGFRAIEKPQSPPEEEKTPTEAAPAPEMASS